MMTLRVQPSDEGMRLDAWLAKQWATLSKTHIKAFIADGQVFLNGIPIRQKAHRVMSGGTYQVEAVPVEPKLQPNTTLPLNVIFEDEALIAVSKPAHMDTQPNHADEMETLANALLAAYPFLMGVGDNDLTMGILHRIDRDTSGLVLIAKTQAVYEALRAQFSGHTVIKHYRALVTGRALKQAYLEHRLAHNPRCPGRMIDADKWTDALRPMTAITEYVRERLLGLDNYTFSLLDVTIKTGVTHQIRAQLSLSGYPIVGDKRYGGYPLTGFDRHFLHAASITIEHPLTHQRVTIEAALTPELTALLGKLKPLKG